MIVVIIAIVDVVCHRCHYHEEYRCQQSIVAAIVITAIATIISPS